MAKITVEANQCDVCGHVWLQTGKTAVQCAKCRTRKWNSVIPDYPAVAEQLQRAYADIDFAKERTVEYEE